MLEGARACASASGGRRTYRLPHAGRVVPRTRGQPEVRADVVEIGAEPPTPHSRVAPLAHTGRAPRARGRSVGGPAPTQEISQDLII
eukprot:1151452-Pyramimonas_sp.AAC.1